MPGSSAPEAQQAVAGWALSTCIRACLLGHHQGAASGVRAVELAGLRYGGLNCQLQQHARMDDAL